MGDPRWHRVLEPAAGMGWERQTWRSLETRLGVRGSCDADSAAPASPQHRPPTPTPVLCGASVAVLGPPRGHGHGGAGHNQQTLEKPALKQDQGAPSCQTAPALAPVGCNTAGQSGATSLLKPHCPGTAGPGRAFPSMGVLMCHPPAPVSGHWVSLQPDPALGRLLLHVSCPQHISATFPLRCRVHPSLLRWWVLRP